MPWGIAGVLREDALEEVDPGRPAPPACPLVGLGPHRSSAMSTVRVPSCASLPPSARPAALRPSQACASVSLQSAGNYSSTARGGTITERTLSCARHLLLAGNFPWAQLTVGCMDCKVRVFSRSTSGAADPA